jgi:3-deoxy-D-manno-octulosonate 8-phosphate phosphatase (KDO 8-P phosphatase)
MIKKLSEAEIKHRAKQVRLVLTDVDGVLTDTGVYYSARGEELKRFSIRDGMGMELLREHGIETAMITRETSGTVEARSKKLNLPYLFLGIWDKRASLSRVMTETNTTISELAYIGDDVNDLDIMEAISDEGLTGCPFDAMPVIASVSHYRAIVPGGHGAFRDFAEWILDNRL